jgi:hypothetical protein
MLWPRLAISSSFMDSAGSWVLQINRLLVVGLLQHLDLLDVDALFAVGGHLEVVEVDAVGIAVLLDGVNTGVCILASVEAAA